MNIHIWRQKFAREGLTSALRSELREILTPNILIAPPQRRVEEPVPPRVEAELVSDLVSWEIVLRGEHVLWALKELRGDDRWRNVIHELLSEFTGLLLDVLDLMRELGGAGDRYDPSYIAQPSIAAHPQNPEYIDWVALIELARDAWLASASASPEMAKLEVQRWLLLPYPVFKRLAFFAATERELFPPETALTWLQSDAGWWLWSTVTQREVMRLLIALSPRLAAHQREQLEDTVLLGPPREMFRDDVSSEQFERICDHAIWLRLSKMGSAGVDLTARSTLRMTEVSKKYPEWGLEADQSDEFPIWMSSERSGTHQASPKQRRALEAFLQQDVPTDLWYEDDWRNRCTNDFSRAATALLSLGLKGHWPAPRWREGLQAWSTEADARRSWRILSKVLNIAPDAFVQEISHSLAWWLHVIARFIEANEATFFNTITRVLLVHREERCASENNITTAINHPVGLVTEAALRWWYRQGLQDDQKLSAPISELFTTLCDLDVEIFRYGRMLLARNSIALLRVDQKWTDRHVLGLFDWAKSSAEANAVWMGFLISPRLNRALVAAIKGPLLETAHHYEELHDLGQQYASLLAFSALELSDVFSPSELAAATASLPSVGLEETARTLFQALTGTATQRGEYWRNRIVPYLRRVWPRNRDLITPNIARHLALVCTATGDAFPEAVEELKDWLVAPNDSYYVVHQLDHERLTTLYPEHALALLDSVITDGIAFAPPELRKCLDDITAASPALLTDTRVQRLQVFVRRRGLE